MVYQRFKLARNYPNLEFIKNFAWEHGNSVLHIKIQDSSIVLSTSYFTLFKTDCYLNDIEFEVV